MRELVARESFLRKDEMKYSSQRLFYNFDFQLKAKIINKLIKKIKLKLIFINNYFDVQFKVKMNEEVREDLSSFLFLN